MNDIQFTPHFKLSEFIRSATATKQGIENNPSPEAVENLRLLSIHTLEPLREALGLPIVITSGYRCKACLGTDSVVSREGLKDLVFNAQLMQDIFTSFDDPDEGPEKDPSPDKWGDDQWTD